MNETYINKYHWILQVKNDKNAKKKILFLVV